MDIQHTGDHCTGSHDCGHAPRDDDVVEDGTILDLWAADNGPRKGWRGAVLVPHFTRLLNLKIGRMMLMAMKPTTLPMATIISGSIMAVTPLMTERSSRA